MYGRGSGPGRAGKGVRMAGAVGDSGRVVRRIGEVGREDRGR